MDSDKDRRSEFSQVAETEGEQSLFGEFIDFLTMNKKWWLAPIIITLILLGGLLYLSGSAAAPFVYSLF